MCDSTKGKGEEDTLGFRRVSVKSRTTPKNSPKEVVDVELGVSYYSSREWFGVVTLYGVSNPYSLFTSQYLLSFQHPYS